MIKVVICGIERAYEGSVFTWIREQYHRRENDGLEFWFMVSIETHDVNLVFSSKRCPRCGGRRKVHVNEREHRIIDMWTHLGAAVDTDVDPLLRFLYRLNEIIA